MIRHRPEGLGNPYLPDADQRLPVDVVEGEPFELRASATASEGPLRVELVVDGQTSQLVAVPLGADEPVRCAPRAGRQAWVAQVSGLPAGASVSYRFLSESGSRTREYRLVVAAWRPEAGRFTVVPGTATHRIVAGPEWLVADEGPVRVRLALGLPVGARVIGFGERFDALDQFGRRPDVRVYEQYKHQGTRTYLPIPFAIVLPGAGRTPWGFHVRSTRRSWFDVGASDPGRLGIAVALDPAEGPAELEIRIYEGAPAEILDAFLAENGGAIAPPDWAFRPWMSGNEWNTEARVRSEITRSLELGIPVGVMVIEAWSDESTFVAFRDARYEVHADGRPHRLGDYDFPPDGAWPDPRGLVEWMHDRGLRVLLWQVPLYKTRPVASDQARADIALMRDRGFGVRESDGSPYRNRGWWFPGALMPDWTNAEAKSWWLERRRYLIEEVGIDGFKTDGGEHGWGDELRYADGSRGSSSNNLVPVLAASAYQELMRSAGREPVTFSRAGFTGSAQFPLHWAGDEDSTWEAFRASITAGLSAAASGIFFWGWDLAGFSGDIPDAELYLRAAAVAAFSPIMQYHAEYNGHRTPSNDRTPWNIAERTRDPRVLTAYRRLAQTRDRIVPYLVEQGGLAVTTGRPLMRALAFEWPDDQRVWNYPFQYLLGDDLLVAPVVEPGVMELEVYLPDGEWVDAWTGARMQGGRVVARDAEVGTIPLFLRNGRTLPIRP